MFDNFGRRRWSNERDRYERFARFRRWAGTILRGFVPETFLRYVMPAGFAVLLLALVSIIIVERGDEIASPADFVREVPLVGSLVSESAAVQTRNGQVADRVIEHWCFTDEGVVYGPNLTDEDSPYCSTEEVELAVRTMTTNRTAPQPIRGEAPAEPDENVEPISTDGTTSTGTVGDGTTTTTEEETTTTTEEESEPETTTSTSTSTSTSSPFDPPPPSDPTTTTTEPEEETTTTTEEETTTTEPEPDPACERHQFGLRENVTPWQRVGANEWHRDVSGTWVGCPDINRVTIDYGSSQNGTTTSSVTIIAVCNQNGIMSYSPGLSFSSSAYDGNTYLMTLSFSVSGVNGNQCQPEPTGPEPTTSTTEAPEETTTTTEPETTTVTEPEPETSTTPSTTIPVVSSTTTAQATTCWEDPLDGQVTCGFCSDIPAGAEEVLPGCP